MRNGYRAPSPAGKALCRGQRCSRIVAFPIGEGGTAPAVDRVLSYIVDLRRISPLIFHTARTLSGSLRSPPSPRGEGFVRRYSFSTYACIRFDDARKAVFSYRSLPHWGRGTAPAVDRVLSQTAHLRRSPSLSFIPLVPYPARFARHLPLAGKALCRGQRFPPIQPPPLRDTSFHRKEGMSTRAPSLGRGCRAQRGGVGFLFCGQAASSLPSPLGKGDRVAVDRVLS